MYIKHNLNLSIVFFTFYLSEVVNHHNILGNDNLFWKVYQAAGQLNRYCKVYILKTFVFNALCFTFKLYLMT